MKRAALASILFFGAVFAAHADSAVRRATVVAYEEMPYSLNHHDVAQMTLRIKPPRGPAFETTITRSVSRQSPPHRGATMSVRCDPANPQDVHPVD